MRTTLIETRIGHSFLDAIPTAELEPTSETYMQADEASPFNQRMNV